MKLVSWNVNGIRAAVKKGFLDYLAKENPDILCIQESKAGRDPIQIETPGYTQYWYNAERPGYSGTVVFTKQEPFSVQKGIALDGFDDEGRVLTLEYKDFFLVNVYTPNAKDDLSRLAYRQEWDAAFLQFLQHLEKKKPVIACGDFNVAHKEIDLARPKQNEGKKGFTKEERDGFQAFIDADFLDTFREFNTNPKEYSWWSYRANARVNNVGWRIDYFLCSKTLKSRLKDAFIRQKVTGSDHCPVGIVLDK